MYKILISTHGTLASSFVDTLRLFVSQADNVEAVDLSDKSIYLFENELQQKIEKIDQPILVMTDLYQGTPFKSCFHLLANREDVKIIANMNFAGLLTASVHSQDKELDDVVEEIMSTNQLVTTNTLLDIELSDEDE